MQASELTVPLQLAAGAMAGMTATALTHPLDVMRLRLALPQSPYTGKSLPACTTTRHLYTETVLAPSALRSLDVAMALGETLRVCTSLSSVNSKTDCSSMLRLCHLLAMQVWATRW